MIRLVVGLGNPGQQYEKTRHNAGFLFLDGLVFGRNCTWVSEPKFHGLVSEYVARSGKVILLKTQTFMNRSGLAVGGVARYYKFRPEEILVIHDELDFGVGVAKLKKGGGHAGHNGLRDIIAQLGSNDFYRLRIGIGRPASGKVVADYVLSEPSKADSERLKEIFALGISKFDQIVTEDLAVVMNKFNALT